ncbi:hypothetical protein PRZ48_006085 [Zasmidium cellare]|uniref:Carbonic anhydrase n=1 Tax=Zasmidium cellare TaxID=395010 RepID=A0ABR0EM59_ZASCE|nr:hypothetical protein PRZ48_006085 [Zasmidium cellare]
MPTKNVQRLLKDNEKYAAQLTGGDLPVLPSRLCCLVTCHDARIDPTKAFGIGIGQCHVIRNAGGSIKDALRSILISQHMLGTREVILVKHTDCGTASFTNEEAHETVNDNQGEVTVPPDFDFMPFVDPETSVREEVAWLKSLKALYKGTVVSGLVYDVETGKVKQVV